MKKDLKIGYLDWKDKKYKEVCFERWDPEKISASAIVSKYLGTRLYWMELDEFSEYCGTQTIVLEDEEDSKVISKVNISINNFEYEGITFSEENLPAVDELFKGLTRGDLRRIEDRYAVCHFSSVKDAVFFTFIEDASGNIHPYARFDGSVFKEIPYKCVSTDVFYEDGSVETFEWKDIDEDI